MSPVQFKDDPDIKHVRNEGFNYNGKDNIVEIKKFDKSTGSGQHGNHPNYNKQFLPIAKHVIRDFKDGVQRFFRLTARIRQYIQEHPDIKINEIDFKNIDLNDII